MQENDTLPFNEKIVVVSGMPRSGTSMMMQLLQAGGVEILTDNLRQKDESNPRGYLEFERVKKLKSGDFDWLDQAKGKAVKVISSLLADLPDRYSYKIIFMTREMDEILASQQKMLHRSGIPADEDADARLRGIYQKHLSQVSGWLKLQSSMDVIYINYNQAIENPRAACEAVAGFLSLPLDIPMMVTVVTQELYHQRSAR